MKRSMGEWWDEAVGELAMLALLVMLLATVCWLVTIEGADIADRWGRCGTERIGGTYGSV
jgi:hypothetical protein